MSNLITGPKLPVVQLTGPPPDPNPPLTVGERVLYGWPREDYNQYIEAPGEVLRVHEGGLLDVRFEWLDGFRWTMCYEPQWGFVRVEEPNNFQG